MPSSCGMALELVEALRQEQLAESLCVRLDQERSGRGPLQSATVVVQNAGLGRWLQLRHSERNGISAGLELPLARSFIARELEQMGLFNRRHGLESARMRWCVFDILSARAFDGWGETAAPLRRYLAQGHPKFEQRCWQLAGQMADLFDQYAMYRPAWVLQWLSGAGPGACGTLPHAGWQACLFQSVQSLLGLSVTDMERCLFGLALHRFAQGGGAGQPSRAPVHVFGVSTFPPAFIRFFKGLAERCNVSVYHLVCSEAYLGELPKTYRRALEDAGDYNMDTEAASELVDNPLLIYSGQATARFQSLLLALDFPVGEMPVGSDEPSGSDLEALQRAVRSNLPRMECLRADGSVSIHSCHSIIREVQVLQQQLLALFAADADLRPEEILVLAPEIGDYADAIESVFGHAARTGAAHESIRIPYCIADRLASHDANCWRFLESLLGFLKGRQSFSELAELLDFDPVCQHLGISREEMQEVLVILQDTGIRWGIDGAVRAQQGQPNFEAYSWDYGLQRLYDGLIYPEVGHEACAPYGTSSRVAEIIGEITRMLRRAFEFVRSREAARPFGEWVDRLLAVVKDCVGDSEGGDSWYAVIFPALGDVSLVATDQAIGFETFTEIALGAQNAPSGPSGLLRRGVTFCRMQPVRHIPAKVLCVLGLNEGAYPRQPRRLEFDLLQQQRRLSGASDGGAPKIDELEYLGDPRLRDEDRQLFLDCLLNARQRLYLSYVGQSNTDKKGHPPSLLVSELEQFLALPAEGEAPEERQAQLARVRVAHPLQEWSRRNFMFAQPRAGEALVPIHFENELADLRESVEAAPGFLSHEVAVVTDPNAEKSDRGTLLDVAHMVRFFADPAGHYLKHCLQVNLKGLEWETVFEDEESLDRPDSLRAWGLRQETVNDWFAVRSRSDAPFDRELYRQRMERALRLPPGLVGDAIWRESILPLLDVLEATIDTSTLEKRAIECAVGDQRIVNENWFSGDGCQLIVLNGELKAKGAFKPKALLEVCLRHICGGCDSRVLCLKSGTVYRIAGTFEGSSDWLELLVTAWRVGQGQPLPFSFLIAEGFVRALIKDPDLDEATALRSAYHAHWENDPNWNRYGDETPAQLLCFDGDSPAAPGSRWAGAFVRNASDIIAPLLRWSEQFEEEVCP